MDGDVNEANIRVAMNALTTGLDGVMEAIRRMSGTMELVAVLLNDFFETGNFTI